MMVREGRVRGEGIPPESTTCPSPIFRAGSYLFQRPISPPMSLGNLHTRMYHMCVICVDVCVVWCVCVCVTSSVWGRGRGGDWEGEGRVFLALIEF